MLSILLSSLKRFFLRKPFFYAHRFSLFRGESGASRSTVERKIFGPSSFSTGFQTFLQQRTAPTPENLNRLFLETPVPGAPRYTRRSRVVAVFIRHPVLNHSRSETENQIIRYASMVGVDGSWFEAVFSPTTVDGRSKIGGIDSKVTNVSSRLPNVVFLTNSGTEATELALMIARLYSGCHDIISLINVYHGNASTTKAAIAERIYGYYVVQPKRTMVNEAHRTMKDAPLYKVVVGEAATMRAQQNG
ncbi:alanine--glyoxylate aminotransferase 2 homolog 3, mitochondrial [Tanacetum coccineum]